MVRSSLCARLRTTPCPKRLRPETIGETWLNYTRRGMGMFWWGGEDVSTEHRAYMNLRRGVKAPRSGSIEENGKTAAEQIGGQIFVDTWGLICPGDPARAADLAAAAASVSHGGSGVDGARFMAACVAAAYTASSLDEVLDAGLRFLPEKCDYRRVVETVRAYHRAHPAEADFRACREMIAREFSDEEYPGGYHIVPNAGICILAMLYGKGELGRSIEISVMCGYDTDCNASNIARSSVCSAGLGGVPERYRRPINDLVTLSSVSGYLNLVDLSDKAKELGALSCGCTAAHCQRISSARSRASCVWTFRSPARRTGSSCRIRRSTRCASFRERRTPAHSAPSL